MGIKKVSVTDFGAVANGVTDCRAAFQAALDSGADEVFVPLGLYSVSGTLFIRSDTRLTATRGSHICLRPTERLRRGDFLLSTDPSCGTVENITVSGGIWDGGASLPECAVSDTFDENGYSGAVLNFVGVRGLSLSGITVANSAAYYIRLCRIEDFVISDVSLVSDTEGKGRDGLHFAGECRRGRVKDLTALSRGQTDGDLIALNADDRMNEVRNLGLCCGAIEDISFENVYAEDCYTAVRLLSVSSPIRNIRIKHMHVGYRKHVINMDAGRYGEAPLFDDSDYPEGVGCIENLSVSDMTVRYTPPVDTRPLAYFSKFAVGVKLETLCDNIRFRDCYFVGAEDFPPVLALTTFHLPNVAVHNGRRRYILDGDKNLSLTGFRRLTVNKIKPKGSIL